MASFADNQWFTYFNDWVGTKRMEVSQSGDMYEGYRSLPFGESLDWDYYGGPDVSYKQFTGQPLDFDSQLGNFGARDYKFGQSRFMTPDPSGLAFADPSNPQSLNLYSYVLGNPLINIDPTGMWIEMSCVPVLT